MKVPLISFVVGAAALNSDDASGVNPIRKVVTMLQAVQKKVEAEAKKEEALFSKYMCYCKTAGGDLEKSISAATTKVPQLQSDIEAAESHKVQLDSDLEKHQSDRTAAKTAIAEATALREKEAAEFASVKAEYSANIDAINKAVAALEKGMSGAFLQSSGAATLRNLVQSKLELDDDDRQQLMAFLGSAQDSDYSPQSGSITGILKTQGDQMSAALADAQKEESAAIASFQDLSAAKKKEIAANTAAIEEKTVRAGEVAVSIAQMKNDLTDTEEALIEDKKFLADLGKNCKTKQAEWDDIVKVRAEEQVALAETIKILNDDDALEMFKKTLPGASSSLLEVASTLKSRNRALVLLRNTRDPRVDFLAMALHGKKVGFEKVIKMIDDMVALLKTEQADDDHKKEYCNIQFDAMDDKKKGLERTVSDSTKAIDDAKETIATMASEVEALEKGIKALDKSVADASEQRKAENADFTELIAQDTAAKELLGLAKNRLNKFYNPKLYVAPEAANLAQVRTHDAPPPPPEAPGAYSKKSEEANGVIGMLDQLAAELDKEMTVAKAEEKDAQADYEQSMKDAAEKRATDSKAIVEKNGAKADNEAAMERHTDDKASASKELGATLQVIQSLHTECDFLLKYFDVRAEARSSEIDALGKAKAVLSGADFAFVQIHSNLRGA